MRTTRTRGSAPPRAWFPNATTGQPSWLCLENGALEFALACTQQYGRQYDYAVDEHLPERGDSHQRQTAADEADEQAAQHDAHGRTRTARDRDAADETGGYHRQLEAQSDVRVRHRETRNPKVTAD